MNISDFLTSITANLNFIIRSVILGLLFGILVSYLALDTYKINSRLISLSGELNPIDLPSSTNIKGDKQLELKSFF